MNTSREPPRPRYRDQCSRGASYRNPPEYQPDDVYFVRDGDRRSNSNTPLKRMPRVKKGRSGQSRGDDYWQNQPADDYQRGELDHDFQFPTEPPRERIQIKNTPRHRLEAGAIGRPWSWIDTEGITVEVTSLPESDAELVDVPRMDPMAESNPEEDGMQLNLVPVTDAELLLLKDFRKFKDRQRKNMYQRADTARAQKPAGSQTKRTDQQKQQLVEQEQSEELDGSDAPPVLIRSA
ncbi:unnamed protein product [Clonostachys solani]|uniref:Uncharacterized protein n=1 Tax=Clonostachys solani TaxID=160281 RepID=A0A9P0EFI6_9HYPO|nr:unnamed protein product [Clonostachys solani]